MEITDIGSGALDKMSAKDGRKCNVTTSDDSLELNCMEEGGEHNDTKSSTDSNTDPGQPAVKNESCFTSKNFTEIFTE